MGGEPVNPSTAGSDRLAELTHRDAPWAGLRAVVAGLGVTGFAAADALLQHEAEVTVIDAGGGGERQDTQANILQILGADVRRGAEHVSGWPADLSSDEIDVIIASPGWRPDHPVFVQAQAHGIPIWSEVELAWRLRPRVGAAPWLVVTGTNGKTSTVQLLESILQAAGLRAIAVGNVGTPVLDAVQHPEPYDVIAVELSSFQLQHTYSMSPLASCVLNLAPDHVDWHGSYEAYVAAKARIYERTQVACVYNVQDPATETLVEEAEVIEGARAIGFTLGVPAPSMVGLVEDVLADRAFVVERATSAAELGTLADLAQAAGGSPDTIPAPHLVANALAAAALARAVGVEPRDVRRGLANFRIADHRMAVVAEQQGITWVNDSKATNPHAAQAALRSYGHIVWVAGGQLKGADVDDLVADIADRLRAVVLLGADRQQIAAALSRHAPQVPVQDVGVTDHGDVQASDELMSQVVRYAADHAQPGDVVLLSPAAASLDMWPSYGARGDAFAAAVRRLLGEAV